MQKYPARTGSSLSTACKQRPAAGKGENGMRESLYDYCVRTKNVSLLQQWHPVKNGTRTPVSLSYGSSQKVWWQCGSGHEWQAAIYTRTTRSSGCPYCAGKLAKPGETDLASQRPDLAAQWHPAKNAPLTPDRVSPGSRKTVWWVCEKGHQWQAMVKTRAFGCGCPYCANRALQPGQNDLSSTHPALAAQWHRGRNGSLTPENVSAGTRRKAWWICEKGHEWQAAIASRAAGSGCPFCAGRQVILGENDLASQFPMIAAQWDRARNGTLTPEQVTPYSNRRVWWRCAQGHEWRAPVGGRTKAGSDCPYCTNRKVLAGFNDLATLEPDIAAQWHPTLNGAMTPDMVTLGSHQRVWWQCAEGHVWNAVVYSRTGPQKCGCPVCAGRISGKRLEQYGKLCV